MVLSRGARWANLWPSEGFSKSVTPHAVIEELESNGDEDTSERGIFNTIISDVSSFLFMGNLALFLGLLVVIFTIHVLMASGMEAYWLAKVGAVVVSAGIVGTFRLPPCSTGFISRGLA